MKLNYYYFVCQQTDEELQEHHGHQQNTLQGLKAALEIKKKKIENTETMISVKNRVLNNISYNRTGDEKKKIACQSEKKILESSLSEYRKDFATLSKEIDKKVSLKY
jgi:hypothetical protein